MQEECRVAVRRWCKHVTELRRTAGRASDNKEVVVLDAWKEYTAKDATKRNLFQPFMQRMRNKTLCAAFDEWSDKLELVERFLVRQLSESYLVACFTSTKGQILTPEASYQKLLSRRMTMRSHAALTFGLETWRGRLEEAWAQAEWRRQMSHTVLLVSTRYLDIWLEITRTQKRRRQVAARVVERMRDIELARCIQSWGFKARSLCLSLSLSMFLSLSLSPSFLKNTLRCSSQVGEI